MSIQEVPTKLKKWNKNDHKYDNISAFFSNIKKDEAHDDQQNMK